MSNLRGLNSLTLNVDDELPPLPSGTFRLFSMRFCPFAQKTVLYLAKKNIPVQVVNVNIQHKPKWFVDRNPLGKVPTFEHDGKIVYDSTVVNDYLDDIFPDSSVLPKDPYERAHQRILAERLSSIGGAFFGLSPVKAENQAAALDRLKVALENAEALLADDFYGGKSTGYADLSVWPFLERLETLTLRPELGLPVVPGKQFPKLTAYVVRMKQLPEIKATMRPAEEHAAFLKSLFEDGAPNYNIGLAIEH